MIKIKQFKKQHFGIFSHPNILDNEIQKTVKYAKTLFWDNKVMAIVFFTNKWAKHYEAILFVSPNVWELSFPARLKIGLKAVRVFKTFKELYKPIRVQANCLATFKTGVKFVEKLGFAKEGLLKKFGEKGDDYYRYAWVS